MPILARADGAPRTYAARAAQPDDQWRDALTKLFPVEVFTAYLAAVAILSGVGLALWLSYFLITSDQFPSDLGGFFIPWDRIIFISVFTFIASLVMTFIPSRQAASVPTAEALRYE